MEYLILYDFVYLKQAEEVVCRTEGRFVVVRFWEGGMCMVIGKWLT